MFYTTAQSRKSSTWQTNEALDPDIGSQRIVSAGSKDATMLVGFKGTVFVLHAVRVAQGTK